MIVKKCLMCGQKFGTYPSRIKIGIGKYCSHKCWACSKENKERLIKEGRVEKLRFSRLGKLITEEWKKKIGLANSVALKGKKLSPNHPFCQKGKIPWNKNIEYAAIKGEKNWNWKGGKSRTNLGYILIYKPEHPFPTKKRYVFEHRLIAEKCLSRYLLKLERIHHINGIKDDNRPENLYLFSYPNDHDKFHHNPYQLTSNII